MITFCAWRRDRPAFAHLSCAFVNRVGFQPFGSRRSSSVSRRGKVVDRAGDFEGPSKNRNSMRDLIPAAPALRHHWPWQSRRRPSSLRLSVSIPISHAHHFPPADASLDHRRVGNETPVIIDIYSSAFGAGRMRFSPRREKRKRIHTAITPCDLSSFASFRTRHAAPLKRPSSMYLRSVSSEI